MNQDFEKILKNNVSDYEGEHKAIIKKAPELYALACKLLRDVKIIKATRLKLLAAIGYFIIPDDIYPEDVHGPIGYVEDIMLLQYIFREINSEVGKKPLERNWNGTEADLISAIGAEFNTLKTAYPHLFKEVVNFTGV
jgi:uncharacterized membrane protein YkvA (DUF1232 family)|tara:strand:- start:24 stop:437 length:414 start_codon:yes stop_codon:yes gene_type:complete